MQKLLTGQIRVKVDEFKLELQEEKDEAQESELPALEQFMLWDMNTKVRLN